MGSRDGPNGIEMYSVYVLSFLFVIYVPVLPFVDLLNTLFTQLLTKELNVQKKMVCDESMPMANNDLTMYPGTQKQSVL